MPYLLTTQVHIGIHSICSLVEIVLMVQNDCANVSVTDVHVRWKKASILAVYMQCAFWVRFKKNPGIMACCKECLIVCQSRPIITLVNSGAEMFMCVYNNVCFLIFIHLYDLMTMFHLE